MVTTKPKAHRDFLHLTTAYDVFILDLDGTLWNGSSPIAGTAQSTYELLRDPSKRVLFYTNGGYCSRQYTFEQVVKWLKQQLEPDQFKQISHLVTINTCYNTAYLTARYLTEMIPKDSKVLTIGNHGLNDEIKLAGFTKATLLVEDEIGMSEQEFSDYQIDPEVKAVVKGVCEQFNFRKIAIASLYLADPEMVFGATNEDYTWVCGKSLRHMPDVGATLRAIEASCGRKAFTVGKPKPYAFKVMLEDHFHQDKHMWQDAEYRSRFVYVGDNMDTDVLFAREAGIHSCLVLTGMTQPEDFIPDCEVPNVLMRSFTN